jgi:4a-hydroxytetrahydrobiopterin dehydratase
MDDSRTRWSAAEVHEAGLADWRQVLGRLRARFRTGDFATGLVLVNRIGAAAEVADHHPDVVLTYPEVVVTLVSHDVGGLTRRDVELAREISRMAADLGVGADVAGLTQVELGLDTSAGAGLAPFYAALLGGKVDHGEVVDPSGQTPTVWWQDPDGAGDDEHPLPPQPFEQRWHLDVWVPHDEAEARLQAVLDAGGRLVSDSAAPAYWVVEDSDGNRSCICTPEGR